MINGYDDIDYLISNKHKIEQGEMEAKDLFTEEVDLENLTDEQEINNYISANDLDLPNSNFIFSCFNSHQKIMPDVFEVWMRILKCPTDVKE